VHFIELLHWIQPKKPQEKRLLSAFLQKMEKHGYRKKTSQGLEEFVSQIDDDRLRQQASAFVRSFEEIYFHDRVFTREHISGLRDILTSM